VRAAFEVDDRDEGGGNEVMRNDEVLRVEDENKSGDVM